MRKSLQQYMSKQISLNRLKVVYSLEWKFNQTQLKILVKTKKTKKKQGKKKERKITDLKGRQKHSTINNKNHITIIKQIDINRNMIRGDIKINM